MKKRNHHHHRHQRETDAKRSNIRQGYLRDGHAAHDRALRLPEGHPQRAALLDRARDCFQKVRRAGVAGVVLLCLVCVCTYYAHAHAFIRTFTSFFQRRRQAVKAPKELMLAVLARLRDCGVELLVAPYEADAQVRPFLPP